MRPLILVVGAPRSGMSFIARLLHEQLNICMGHDFRKPNAASPKGEYQDIDMSEASAQLIADRTMETIGANGPVAWEPWMGAFETCHADCDKLWRGFKSPQLSYLPFHELKPIWVIRLSRMADLVIASMQKHLGMTRDDAERLFLAHENALDDEIAKLTSETQVSILPLRLRHWADKHMEDVLRKEAWMLDAWKS